MINPT